MWCQLQFVFMLLSFRMVFNQLFPGRVLSSVMEIFGSVSVWASSPSAHRRAASGWALWGLWARGCPLFSGGPQGAPTPSLTRRRRTLCLQTGLGEQLAGALSPQGPQGSGSWIMGLRPGWEERGCFSAREQGAGQWASQLPLNFVWVSLGLCKKVSSLSDLIFFCDIAWLFWKIIYFSVT